MKNENLTIEELKLIRTCIDTEWLRREENGYTSKMQELEALEEKIALLINSMK